MLVNKTRNKREGIVEKRKKEEEEIHI